MHGSADTVLFALELGGNSGHLSRSFAIARALESRGYGVVFSVNDVTRAERFNANAGYVLIKTPLHSLIPPKVDRPLINHAEILKQFGYDRSVTLSRLVSGWLRIMGMVKPTCVVIDYAPTAVLAARILGIKTIVIGSGFDLPPDTAPMPSFLRFDGELPPAEQLMQLENEVVSVVNAVLSSHQSRPIERLSQLFTGDQRFVANFPQLDVWGSRPNETYIGHLEYAVDYVPVEWDIQDDGRRRVFAYLKPDMPRLIEILLALSSLDAEIICVIPGINQEFASRFSTKNQRVFSRMVTANRLLPKASVVFSYGGAGMIASALLHGVPMVARSKPKCNIFWDNVAWEKSTNS
jgi:UDP:flavonoid glycosyltransferase YjiC (YdhE family)